MKISFIIGLVVFWTAVVVLTVAGLVSYENQKLADSLVGSGGGGTEALDDAVLAEAAKQGVSEWTPELVAVHSVLEDCWMTIDGGIYDVTEYVPFHPGGTQTILDYCGAEATEAFRTKGGAGGDHSDSAYAMLENYHVADVGDPLSLGQQNAMLQGGGTAPLAETTTGGGGTETAAPQAPAKTTTPPPVAKPASGSGLTAGVVAAHNTENDCWLIINSKVYDVTQYMPFHPGGTNTITPWCGKESTNAFKTKGGGGSDHSAGAWSQLENYFIGALDTSSAAPAASAVPIGSATLTLGASVRTLSELNVRSGAGTHNASLGRQPLGATGVLVGGPQWSSGYWWWKVDYTIGADGWSAEAFLLQYTVASVPVVDTTPSQDTTQNDMTQTDTTQTDQQTTGGLTSDTVATHDSVSDCWLIINNKVYDVTQYMPFHPGGTNTITPWCGKESTNAFSTKGGDGSNHSTNAWNMLDNYYIGDLGSGTTPADTTQPAADTILPIVTITEPTNGAVLSGDVIVRATASDASGIASVAFALDGSTFRTDTSASYSASIDTTSYSDGTYTIEATARDENGNERSTSVTVTFSNTVPNPVPTSGLTPSAIATHDSVSDCWLIINDMVYDVTQYIPFHPGGTNTITPWCGKESTNAFSTKGGDGSNHSSSAWSQLDNYYIGDVVAEGTTEPTADTIAPSVSLTAPQNGASVSDTITITASATDLGGVASVVFSIDGSVLTTDTTSPYETSLDTTAYSDGSHTLTAEATDTSGNSNSGSITINVSNAAPAPTGTLDSATVSAHNTVDDCWFIYSNKVYDVTQYIPVHPGGTNTITPYCGKDGTAAFDNEGHSSNARNLLANYLIGDYAGGTGDPATDPTVPPADPSEPYREAILAEYPGANITKLSIEDDGRAEFKFDWNGNEYEGKMDASYNITEIDSE